MITLDEAIRLLSKEVRPPAMLYETELDIAMKLGIEALRRVKNIRTYPKFRGDSILPGEGVKT